MGTSDFCFLTFVAVLLQTISRISNVSASGYFELQILEISNTNNHLLSGFCCGMPPEMMNRKTTTGCPPCSTAFRLCLKEYQSTPQTEPGLLIGCSFGNASTVVLGASSFVLSDPEVGSIVLPFTFRWTKSFTLILQALDLYNSSYSVSDQLIEETSFSGVILPSSEWNTLDHIGKNARITYRVRVQCDPNYYNTTCTTFCRPRNDQFGHYTCGDKGNKVCLPGWQGANCEKAICKPGCDPAHGKCDQPGECECRPGWEGPLCADCTVYPGCRHGYCNGKAWQCICDTNWGGILCDQDLNYCGTHEPCMHGGTCENTAPDKYQCTCAEGLSGLRCEIVEHPCATLPCKNGGTCTLKDPAKYDTSQMKAPSINNGNVNSNIDQTQQTTVAVIRGMRGMSSIGKPMGNIRTSDARTLLAGSSAKPSLPQILPAAGEFTCTCAAGWTGPTCEINIDECAGGPCEHGGTCVDLVGGFRCECPTQWTGELCHIDVDECESNSASPLGPCINAQACHNTPGAFHCSCLEGWGGATCAKDLDDCVGQCRNGATCIDLVNDYHCACAVGYTGRDCSTDIDECANSPCRNGGECVDMIGTFKCICPVGYSGSLCEVNEAKDHCTPSQCIEGSCLNTPSGYYCHCPPGRSGRHCEHPRAPCETPPCNGCSPTLSTSVASSMPAILINLTSTSTPSSVIPCNGRGKCESSSSNGPYCVCQLGFTGPFCQHNLNECSSNPCKNNGICLDGDNDFSCDCTSGWTGKICGERATQCLPGQCLNGGSCVPSPLISAAAQCRCTSGWGGPFCSEPVDQCQGQPCHNGGTCESGPGWFRCLCARGFSGPDCRINVNECSPQPCLGGATCQDGIGGFTCICPTGRRGTRCEILLSDPSSVCLNASTLSPYNPLVAVGADDDNGFNQTGYSQDVDENNCNACFCLKGKPTCTNLWCGLPNCLASSKTGNITNKCEIHEVCVPATQETCLSPPCEPRGDCRALEPSRRVAPPKLPAPITCWPNQAILGDQCARFTILLEGSRLSRGTSIEGVCSNLRTLLAAKLVRNSKINSKNILVLLCDLKTETNDTIELTVSSQPNGASTVSEAVRLLGELLSRQGGARTYNYDQADSAALAAILEVKVETALIQNENTGSGYLVAVACGAALAALCLGVLATLMWRQRISSRSGSGINLSPTMDVSRHEDEKSNNLQNEENFRRYANPLKGSTGSLRGAMELSMTPAPDASTVATLAGPSAVHRSQPLFPPREPDFDKDPDNSKSHRSSQILLYKAQNPDMRKNTVGSIESPHKDFGKRAINCQPMPANIPATPSIVDSDVLTVHV